MTIVELPFMFYVDLMNIRNLLKSEEHNNSPFKNIMTKEWYDYYKEEYDKYYDILQNILLKLLSRPFLQKSPNKTKKNERINEIMKFLLKGKRILKTKYITVTEASFMRSILFKFSYFKYQYL